MKKMLIGFVIGLAACLVIVVTISSQTKAAGDSSSAGTAVVGDISALLPDVGAIYQSALGSPYRQVETEITDPGIAAFFARYMAETGLDKIGTP